MSILTKEERAIYRPEMGCISEFGCEYPNGEHSCREVFEGFASHDDAFCWCDPCLAGMAAAALDTIDALEAENKDLSHRAEAAEATQDAVAMLLTRACSAFEEEGLILGVMWTARALRRCPPVEEARERTRKAAEAFDQILHPNGKCACHGEGRCEWCTHHCEACGTVRHTGCGCDPDDRVEVDTGLEAELHEAEHHIKVLEADAEHADALLENARRDVAGTRAARGADGLIFG